MENFEKKEKATDMDLAMFLIKHINNPCEDLQGNNTRDFYIRETKKALQTFQDPEAKQKLNDVIQNYE